MRKWVINFTVISFLLATPCMKAELASIHRDKLPQTPTVLAALDDAVKLEPCVNHWTNQWSCEISKDDAVAHLSKDLGFLQAAVKENPDNAELLLLTAEVAHYAYNVDVAGAFDVVIDSLKHAEALTPTDIRPPWFRSDLLCQTKALDQGAAGFLAIEENHAWQSLPVAFWDNYAACAIISNMPAHAERALDHMKQLNAKANQMRSFYQKIADKRFTDYDPNKKYEAKDAWYSHEIGNEVEFTATVCGMRLLAHKDWKVDRIEFTNGICLVVFTTGPYKATDGTLHPELVLLARQPLDGESFKDFFTKFTSKLDFNAEKPPACPVSSCLAVEATMPDAYKPNGDGKPHNLFFQKDAPQFPGLLFEFPEPPPVKSGTEGMQVFRPTNTLKRFTGPIYYLVLLDTASSIEPAALKDYEFFIKNLQVE